MEGHRETENCRTGHVRRDMFVNLSHPGAAAEGADDVYFHREMFRRLFS